MAGRQKNTRVQLDAYNNEFAGSMQFLTFDWFHPSST